MWRKSNIEITQAICPAWVIFLPLFLIGNVTPKPITQTKIIELLETQKDNLLLQSTVNKKVTEVYDNRYIPKTLS